VPDFTSLEIAILCTPLLSEEPKGRRCPFRTKDCPFSRLVQDLHPKLTHIDNSRKYSDALEEPSHIVVIPFDLQLKRHFRIEIMGHFRFTLDGLNGDTHLLPGGTDITQKIIELLSVRELPKCALEILLESHNLGLKGIQVLGDRTHASQFSLKLLCFGKPFRNLIGLGLIPKEPIPDEEGEQDESDSAQPQGLRQSHDLLDFLFVIKSQFHDDIP